MPENRDLKTKIQELPGEPGIYKYYDDQGQLIYVGKAKNLKKRVGSYFTKKVPDLKTRRLVSLIHDLEYVVVPSEMEAYLLENSLIKQQQPKYNVLLRDDKSYPYICLTHERFPRIYPTRSPDPEKGRLFGPYTSVGMMNDVLELINSLYTLRTCNYTLSEENIRKGKFKVCLEYHIGNCKGPCEGLQSEEDYQQEISNAVNILKGRLGPVKEYLRQAMQQAAENLEFERAQNLKEKIGRLEKYQKKSVVINPALGALEVVSLQHSEKYYYANAMRVQEGAVVFSENYEFQEKLVESEPELLKKLIANNQALLGQEPREVITNLELAEDQTLGNLTLTLPKIGDKRKLLDLSLRNLYYFRSDKLKERGQKKDNAYPIRVIRQLRQDLNLLHTPRHIECFDNSNLQGSNPVASMVCFRNGRPYKPDYRKFNIKTVEGPDDYASMTEIVARRYRRLIEEGQDLPQLIVIDGGKGQLSAAVEALKELGIYGKIPIIGIAKRLEEIYFPADPYPVHIDKRSESLKLLQRLRDEAHRFAITFHRDKRSKGALSSELEQIKGLGPKSVETLLKHYKTFSAIKAAPEEEVAALVGKQRARVLREWVETHGQEG